MNLPSSPADHVYLAHVEEQARHHETLAGQYRDIAAMLRRTFQLTPIAPPPAFANVPAAPVNLPQTPARPTLVHYHPDPFDHEEEQSLRRELAATDQAIDALEAASEDLTEPVPAEPPVAPATDAIQHGRRFGKLNTKTIERGQEVTRTLSEHGPLSVGKLHAILGHTRISGNALARVLKQLIAQGAIQTKGERAGTRYLLPGETREEPVNTDARPLSEVPVQTMDAVDAVDTSLVREVELPLAATDAERAAASQENRRVRIAARLMDRQVLDFHPKHISDIVLALSERMSEGIAQYDIVLDTLNEMVGRGEVKTILKGKTTYYLRPVLKVRAAIKERLMNERFNGPGSHSRAALMDYARMVPGANAGEVDIALLELVREGQITVRTIGDERFYSRRGV